MLLYWITAGAQNWSVGAEVLIIYFTPPGDWSLEKKIDVPYVPSTSCVFFVANSQCSQENTPREFPKESRNKSASFGSFTEFVLDQRKWWSGLYHGAQCHSGIMKIFLGFAFNSSRVRRLRFLKSMWTLIPWKMFRPKLLRAGFKYFMLTDHPSVEGITKGFKWS